MPNNANIQPAPSIEMDVIEVLNTASPVYSVPEGTALERLTILREIHNDIFTTEQADSETVKEADARRQRILRMKDAAVIAVSELLSDIPARVVQAALHKEYGGKDVGGKTSKTIPAGDGEAFLKAGKALLDATRYVNDGIIPESWKRGEGTRAGIAELLETEDKALLWEEIQGRSKINVSDTITRFFREYTPKALPLWMNPEKLQELSETLLVNADYVKDNPELRAAYATLFETYQAVTA